MRWSECYIPTLREAPGEAEVVSHRLLLKAGMIRKLASGIYSILPLGLRSLRRLERIVREEMARGGALEVFLPAVQPAELWKESGRWAAFGPELLRFQDRHGRDFCLGPTHEEIIVDLVRNELRSWRDLPRNLYQIQTKFRDEIRPRFGLMRGREFTMKDGYSFDRDLAGLDRTFARMEAAYRRIFTRCGLRFKQVEAHSGAIGGELSYEFHVLAGSGEDAVVSCTGCEYAANIEKASTANPPAASIPADAPLPAEVATPGLHTVAEVAAFLSLPPAALVKTLLLEVEGGERVGVLLRGDHQLSEVKLGRVLEGRRWQFASAEQIAQWTGGPVGFSGPVGLRGVRLLADEGVRAVGLAVVGANRDGHHLRHAAAGRDYTPDVWADLRAAAEGDLCLRCATRVEVVRGIEVGHIFKLGTKYSEAMSAGFLDETGRKQPYVMGCYGLGIGRTVAAAIEQNHDASGIIWPPALAPFDVLVTILNPDDRALVQAAEELAGALEGRGLEVLLDDRDERAGVKFKDADLIGIPLRAVFGSRGFKDGQVEISRRDAGERRTVDRGAAADAVIGLRGEMLGDTAG